MPEKAGGDLIDLEKVVDNEPKGGLSFFGSSLYNRTTSPITIKILNGLTDTKCRAMGFYLEDLSTRDDVSYDIGSRYEYDYLFKAELVNDPNLVTDPVNPWIKSLMNCVSKRFNTEFPKSNTFRWSNDPWMRKTMISNGDVFIEFGWRFEVA